MANQERVTIPDNLRYRDMAGMALDKESAPDAKRVSKPAAKRDVPVIWITEDASEYANGKAANFFAGLGLIALYVGIVYGLYFTFFTPPA